MSRLDDHELDARWRDALAPVVYRVDVAGAPRRVATRVARRRRWHAGAVAMAAAVTVAIVVGAVWFVTARHDPPRAVRAHGGGEPVVAVVHVTSLPALQLSVDRTVVPPGLVEIDYLDGGGTHELRIEGVAGFRLEVPAGPTVARVHLRSGRYRLYCDIPGHWEAGENAILTVR